MIVDSVLSVDAGRSNWGFPKRHGTLSWTADEARRTLAWDDGGVRLVAHGRSAVAVPLVAPIRALQQRDDERVVVPGQLRGKVALTRVTVDAGAPGAFSDFCGTRPGLLVSDLRLAFGHAAPIKGSAAVEAE